MTLLELLVVVVLMGILAMIGLPAVTTSLTEVKLGAAAQEVVTALEYAQTLAVITGMPVRVTLVTGSEEIGVERWTLPVKLTGAEASFNEAEVEGGTFEFIGHPINRGSDYVVSFKDDDRFKGVDIVSVDFDGNNKVRFDALGTPSSGGTVELSLQKRKMRVDLHAVTGRVILTE
jgi:prepilin-type N-terminal cleavage/methylation domain-containing protein